MHLKTEKINFNDKKVFNDHEKIYCTLYQDQENERQYESQSSNTCSTKTLS